MAVFVPQTLDAIRLHCRACGVQIPIPFLQRQREVIEPVTPRDFHPVTNNKEWVCLSTTTKCVCGADVTVSFPIVKARATLDLFADEAARIVDDRHVWVFCACGGDRRVVPEINAAVQGFKAKLLTNVPPQSWQMHMKELWSGRARAEHQLFSALDRRAVERYVGDASALIRALGDRLFTYVCTVTRPTPQALDEPMHLAFTMLFCELLHSHTEKGVVPVLHLDAQRPSSIQSQVVGWIEQILAEQRHLLLYPFLTHGVKIPKPVIIVPGSQPCAELADFVAFWIARYHQRCWRNLPVELDPAQLGKLFYVGERPGGGMLITRRDSFPWDDFAH